jgi:hypothetical protein
VEQPPPGVRPQPRRRGGGHAPLSGGHAGPHVGGSQPAATHPGSAPLPRAPHHLTPPPPTWPRSRGRQEDAHECPFPLHTPTFTRAEAGVVATPRAHTTCMGVTLAPSPPHTTQPAQPGAAGGRARVPARGAGRSGAGLPALHHGTRGAQGKGGGGGEGGAASPLPEGLLPKDLRLWGPRKREGGGGLQLVGGGGGGGAASWCFVCCAHDDSYLLPSRARL